MNNRSKPNLYFLAHGWHSFPHGILTWVKHLKFCRSFFSFEKKSDFSCFNIFRSSLVKTVIIIYFFTELLSASSALSPIVKCDKRILWTRIIWTLWDDFQQKNVVKNASRFLLTKMAIIASLSAIKECPNTSKVQN